MTQTEEKDVKPVAVIGLGPAGVAACLELASRGIPVVAFEPGLIGGQVNMTARIDNYPGFFGDAKLLCSKFASDIEAIKDLRLVRSTVKHLTREGDVFRIETARLIAYFKAVVVAAGTRYRPYAVPDTSGSVHGNGFSRCAICDGPLYKGKDVMVVGGGESAFQEGLYLASICKSVTLINRRTVFRASERDVAAFKNLPNTRVIAPAVTVSCSGENNRLAHVVIKDPNDPTDASLETLDVEACFIYIGSDPCTPFVEIPEALDDKGCMEVDEDMKVVSVPGLLGAGDVIDTPLRQVATAVGSGSKAGISAARYLLKERW